jgi:hypothetical protein
LAAVVVALALVALGGIAAYVLYVLTTSRQNQSATAADIFRVAARDIGSGVQIWWLGSDPSVQGLAGVRARAGSGVPGVAGPVRDVCVWQGYRDRSGGAFHVLIITLLPPVGDHTAVPEDCQAQPRWRVVGTVQEPHGEVVLIAESLRVGRDRRYARSIAAHLEAYP